MLVKLTHPLDLPKPIAVAINRASRKTIFISENSSDPRPRVTRPAPAGHATCARRSLTICRKKSGTIRLTLKYGENNKLRIDFLTSLI